MFNLKFLQMKKLNELRNKVKVIDFSDQSLLRGGGKTQCTEVIETYSACDSDYSFYTEDDNGVYIESCYSGGCEDDFPANERC